MALLGIGMSACLCGSASAQQLDLTQILIDKTSVGPEVVSLCDKLCAGNEKRSWLDSAVLVLRGDQPTSELVAHIKLQSRHVPIQGVVLYDTTAQVDVTAEIDNTTCKVTSLTASSSNDLYKLLLSAFRSEIESKATMLGLPC